MKGLLAAGLVLAWGSIALPSPEVLTLELPPAPLELAPGGRGELDLVLDIQSDWHISGPGGEAEGLFPTQVVVTAPPGLEAGPARFPPPLSKQLPWSEGPLPLHEGRVVVSLPISAAADLPPGEYRLTGRVTYQACNWETCLLPQELSFEFFVKVVAVGSVVGISPPPSPKAGNPLARLAEERGLALVLGMVFLLGLGLNLTPCVYPLIPVTVAYFGRGGGGVRHTLPAALAYQLGIAIAYSGLGLVAALTGRLFGELLQRPWVPAVTAGVLFAMALSFFGLYQLRAPAFLTRRLPQSKSRLFGALLMGLFVGAVAAPCVGPATVALLSYVGTSQSLLLGGGVFFVFALGLGAPYLGVALLSRRMGKIPWGGEWTLWVERLLGLLLLGAGLYFLTPLLPGPLLAGLAGGLALIGAIYLGWLGGRIKGGRGFQVVRWATALVGIGLGTWLLLAASPGETLPWEPYSQTSLAQARAEGQPMLLYFSADWCQPCRKLSGVTFRHPEVRAALAGWRLIKVDLTRPSPVGQALVEEFGVVGVPTLIFLSPQEELLRLVGYIGPTELLASLREESF